jgi:hypothetical protein
MGITRPPYSAEFQQQIVELYRAGRTPATEQIQLHRQSGRAAVVVSVPSDMVRNKLSDCV